MTEQHLEYETKYERTWRARYHEYLRSPEWRAQRDRVLRRDGYQCRACQGVPATEVHHTTYKYGRHTPDYLLVSLCAPCHATLTAIDAGEVRAWGFGET